MSGSIGACHLASMILPTTHAARRRRHTGNATVACTLFCVDLRPLRYTLERDAYGQPIRDVHGKAIVLGKREKGVDVLCALAMVREAARADIDLVVIASHDSDLEPAVDEAVELGSAKIETFRWDSPDSYVYQLRPARWRAWCTKLDEHAFTASRDLTPY